MHKVNDLNFDKNRLATLKAMSAKELNELIDRNVDYIKIGDLSGGDMSPLMELRRVAEVMLLRNGGVNPNTGWPIIGE